MNKMNHWLKKTQPYLPYSDFITEISRTDFRLLSDEALKKTMNAFRFQSLSDQKQQAVLFSLAKEIIYRITGLRLFDSQLAAAAALMNGRIAELPTGEGKTLAAVIPALIHALLGLRVHVLTFNDYLAERDYGITRSIYEFCGISVSHVIQGMSKPERCAGYQSSVVYVTAKEAGFDHLKNFLCTNTDQWLPLSFDYAIVDEADSILIDEARNPLVIACDHPKNFRLIQRISKIISNLDPGDYVISEEQNQAYLSEHGILRVEQSIFVENLYDERNIELLSAVNLALQARFLLKRDLDYIVSENQIRIIDEATGRISSSKKYPDLLHAAVEAKEKLPLSGSSMIYNSMSIQNFILQYRKLSGMTGTAVSSKNEFYQVYGLEADVIPPHIPSCRIDHEPRVYATKEEKNLAVIDAISCANQRQQPVLAGTQSVEESEALSEILRERGIPHQVLNAKNDWEEAAVIADAGKLSAVTISTNMAGRGVDIRLGGADNAEREAVQETGGLLVIGTGLNKSTRIDLQLRGRAGRQGDKGESRFFASLEDELFNGLNWLPKTTVGKAAERQRSEAVKLAERAQHHREGTDEASRLTLSKYSYILEQQRRMITDYRNRVLFSSNGEKGVRLAEKQLTLYFINCRWAEYLESMEDLRNGIHLTVIGGLDPLAEYHRMAVSAFDEIMQIIKTDVACQLAVCEITEDGIDMDAAGLGNATTTWTYLIDDSKSQFTSLPRIINGISSQVRGTLFSSGTLTKLRKNLTENLKNSLFKRFP